MSDKKDEPPSIRVLIAITLLVALAYVLGWFTYHVFWGRLRGGYVEKGVLL